MAWQRYNADDWNGGSDEPERRPKNLAETLNIMLAPELDRINHAANINRADNALCAAYHQLRTLGKRTPELDTLYERLNVAIQQEGMVGDSARRFVYRYRTRPEKLRDMLSELSTGKHPKGAPLQLGLFCKALMEEEPGSPKTEAAAYDYERIVTARSL